MAYYYKNLGKWYEVNEFLGTEFSEEITDKNIIDRLEWAEEQEERSFKEMLENEERE